MEIKGVFSNLKLSDTEKDNFSDYLQHTMSTPIVEFVRVLLGDDYLKFIDILSGMSIKIPSQRALIRDLEQVRIYTYVSKYGFTENSISMASASFGKTVNNVRKSVYRVARVLGSEDNLTEQMLDNYIQNIKAYMIPKTDESTNEGTTTDEFNM